MLIVFKLYSCSFNFFLSHFFTPQLSQTCPHVNYSSCNSKIMYYLKYPLTGSRCIMILVKKLFNFKKEMIIFFQINYIVLIILKITNLHLLTFMTREHIPWINSLSFIKGEMSGDFKSQERAALFLFCFAVFLVLNGDHFFFLYNFIYFSGCAGSLLLCRLSSSCGIWGLLFFAVPRFLIVVASPVEHRL